MVLVGRLVRRIDHIGEPYAVISTDGAAYMDLAALVDMDICAEARARHLFVPTIGIVIVF